MLNIKQLEQAQKDFIDALRTAERNAKDENDFDALEHIVGTVLGCLPITLVQTDFVCRNTIKNYLNEQADTQKINDFMRYIWETDTVCFGDSLMLDLMGRIDDFNNKKD